MVRGFGRGLMAWLVLSAGCETSGDDDELGEGSSSSGESSGSGESPGSESPGSESPDTSESPDGESSGSESSSSESSSSESSGSSSESTGTSGETDTSSETDTTGGAASCMDGELLPPLPIQVMGTTLGAGDDFEACGEVGGLDRSYAFVAAQTGVYVIDSAGSSFDTIVYVSAGACEPGPALICNDDAYEDATSQVWVGLDAGELVTVHVDGLDAASLGDFVLTLELEPDPCPMPIELGGEVPETLPGMLAPGPGEMVGSCGGAGNELFVQWTAPAAGSYVIDTIGSSFDTVLHVRDAGCFDELACNDDGVQSQSQVMVELAAGQTIVIVVDAFGVEDGGSYVLHVAGA